MRGRDAKSALEFEIPCKLRLHRFSHASCSLILTTRQGIYILFHTEDDIGPPIPIANLSSQIGNSTKEREHICDAPYKPASHRVKDESRMFRIYTQVVSGPHQTMP